MIQDIQAQAAPLTTSPSEIFEQQRKHAPSLRQTSAAERIRKLNAIRAQVLKYRSEIQQALYADFHKPASETDVTEILSLLLDIKHTRKHLSSWMKPKKVGTPMPLFGSSSHIQYEPKGLALIISPWNYPFYLCMSPLVYAIAAGNCVVIKPSEFTPHTSALTKRLLGEIFPEHEVAVCEGDVSVSQELLSMKFDHVYFTGSPAVGKLVMKAAAAHLASVTLELGGKSPVIVDETADLDDAAEKICWGKFLNAGQTCIAPDYLLVHQAVHEPLIQKIAVKIRDFYDHQGEGIEHSDSLARIINPKNFQRLAGLLEDAAARGAVIAFGGRMLPDECFIEPTVLTEVPPEAQVMQEEIFGPILPVLTFGSLEQAVQQVNSREKPLACYIFSKRQQHIDYVLDRTSAGGCCVNETILHVSNPDLPFGGVNNSGIGKGHGIFGFKEFSNEKAVLKQRTGLTSVKLIYPPYGNKAKTMIDQMLKIFG